MPTYEYVCKDCENHWEEVQKISEPPVELCPKCGKNTAKRQISGGNFILKGGGWYADLYSSSSASKKSEGKSESNGANGASKSESKPSDGGSKSESKGASGGSGGSSGGSSSSGSSGSTSSGSSSGGSKS